MITPDTSSASQFRLLYLFKGTVQLQPSIDPSLSTQMIADHILHSQQHDIESLATIESNVRDMLQNHITADVICLVEIQGECQGVDVVTFIDCLIEQEGKAKERRKREEGKKRRSGRSGVLIENPRA